MTHKFEPPTLSCLTRSHGDRGNEKTRVPPAYSGCRSRRTQSGSSSPGDSKRTESLFPRTDRLRTLGHSTLVPTVLRGNAVRDAPASYRQGPHFALSRALKAVFQCRPLCMTRKPGGPSSSPSFMECLKRAFSDAARGSMSQPWCRGGTTRERRAEHSHGDRGNELNNVGIQTCE